MMWRRGFLGRLLSALSLNAPAFSTQAAPLRLPGKVGGYIRGSAAETLERSADVVIVGGGLAGTVAAVAAARNGAKVALLHMRSMLGGNSSSETRLYPENSLGHNPWCKETGILDEICAAERVRNHEPYIEGQMNSIWDLVLYEWVLREKNISLYLNTAMHAVELKDPNTILAVHAIQMGTEREFIFTAPLFIDTTGDGMLGFKAGADYRWGVEARSEHNESQAPEKAMAEPPMGNTLFFRARDTGSPVPFARPAWAADFPTEADLKGRSHTRIDAGYWWIEVGRPMHQIRQNEEIKHEALRQLMGVWDHIKNRCANKAKAANYGLDFVSFWPYKREARRLLGDHILIQSDLQSPPLHSDAIAHGCWYIDIHHPGGILDRAHPNVKPAWDDAGTISYGIPLRSCYSRNIHNLMMAGRPISASYVAFSSTRVVRTAAVTGQGVGTAAALCRKHRCDPKTLAKEHHDELRRTLMRQDIFLPGVDNDDPLDLARGAEVTASGHAELHFPESDGFQQLDTPVAQSFPISTNRLDAVELKLKSASSTPVRLRLRLRRAVAAYNLQPAEVVAEAEAEVPANSTSWITFRIERQMVAETLYWVELPRTPGLAWAIHSDPEDQATQHPAGCTATHLPGTSRWQMFGAKAFCLRVTPKQYPYAPANIVRGTNRPDQWTNLWVSDQQGALPAWVELKLKRPSRIGVAQITFDTDVNRLSRKPLFRYPDCIKAYDVSVWSGGAWRKVAGETDNYMRRRELAFAPVTTDRVRIDVAATNGARSARIYEVRLYTAPVS
jgi:hypothetical protein